MLRAPEGVDGFEAEILIVPSILTKLLSSPPITTLPVRLSMLADETIPDEPTFTAPSIKFSAVFADNWTYPPSAIKDPLLVTKLSNDFPFISVMFESSLVGTVTFIKPLPERSKVICSPAPMKIFPNFAVIVPSLEA